MCSLNLIIIDIFVWPIYDSPCTRDLINIFMKERVNFGFHMIKSVLKCFMKFKDGFDVLFIEDQSYK